MTWTADMVRAHRRSPGQRPYALQKDPRTCELHDRMDESERVRAVMDRAVMDRANPAERAALILMARGVAPGTIAETLGVSRNMPRNMLNRVRKGVHP